jgi:putative transposase
MQAYKVMPANCPKAGAHLDKGLLKLSKIGEMPVIMHRPIPDGFTLKTCTIVHKADGWYCCISIQDETVPEPMPLDKVVTAAGVDVTRWDSSCLHAEA